MTWFLLTLASAATLTVGPAQPYTTVQAGVDAAADGDTIEIEAGSYPDPVSITGRTLELVGLGGPVLSASALGPAVRVDGGAVVLRDLVLDGDGTDRALFVTGQGSVTLDGVTASNGTDPAGSAGAIVFAEDHSVLDIVDSVLQGGMPVVTGGVLMIDGNVDLTLRGTTVVRDGVATSAGGGLWHDGVAAEPLVVADSVLFENNSAGGRGGGLYTTSSDVQMSGATFRSNTAREGGGMMAVSAESIAITDTLFEGNEAAAGGGANVLNTDATEYADFTGCTFDSNLALDLGGGLFAHAEHVTVEDSFFFGNQAAWDGVTPRLISDFTFETQFPAGSGGAVFTYADFGETPELWLMNVELSGNSAAANGGAIGSFDVYRTHVQDSLIDGNSAVHGGGARSARDTVFTIRDSTVRDNTASGDGGGVDQDQGFVVQYNGSLFEGNTAGGVGGGVHDDRGLTEILGSTFRANRAANGGGYHGTDSWPEIADTHFEANVAALGAALYAGDLETALVQRLSACLHDDPGVISTVELHGALTSDLSMEGSVIAFNAGSALVTSGQYVILDHLTLVGNAGDSSLDASLLTGTHLLSAFNPGQVAMPGAWADLGWNLWWSNGGPGRLSPTDVVADPLLLDAALASCDPGRLRPGPGSPAIDAGDPSIQEPDGSAPDIGAFGGTGPHPAPEPAEFGCAPLLPWYSDGDTDGIGGGAPTFACAQPLGTVGTGGDCDDGNPAVGAPGPAFADLDLDGFGGIALGDCVAYPGSVAVGGDCDDADAAIGSSIDWYLDSDGDGYGTGAPVAGCDPPPNHVAADGDCDDGDPALNPDTVWYADDDLDGFGDPLSSVVGCAQPPGYVLDDQDCDDTDPLRNPDSVWYFDQDLDGWGGAQAPVGGCVGGLGLSALPGDCDDQDPDENPDAVWYPDLDGDGYGDEAQGVASCTDPGGGLIPIGGDCDDTDPLLNPSNLWYPDGDGDGYGDGAALPVGSCGPPAATGWSATGDDCNDAEPTWNPGAVWAPDLDGDGYGSAANSVAQCAPPGPGALPDASDCDDTDPALNPETWWYADDDGDGFGRLSSGSQHCEPEPGEIRDGTDCDDSDPDVHPGASGFVDGDGDGYGDPERTTDACAPDAVQDATDCDDSDPSINPGAVDQPLTDLAEDCGSPSSSDPTASESEGCGCASAPSPASPWLGLLLVAGIALRSRRG